MTQNLGNEISALKNIAASDYQQYALGWALDQAASRLQYGDAGPFRSDQRPCHMKTIFRKKKIQVVTGDTPGDVGEFLAHQIAVFIGQQFQSGIDVCAPPTLADDILKLFARCAAHAHPNAVIGENFKLFDIFIGLARHHRMDAAGIIPDHSTDGTAAVRSRIRTESEVKLLRRVAKMIENNSRLHSRDSPLWIKLDNL